MTIAVPQKLRVLVVDDSAVIRRFVCQALGEDPGIEVIGTAPNGRVALERISALRPDVVTMDIEMPEMDGTTALLELRKTWPRLPVIMFSTLTERGAVATINALLAGATDYVTKPTAASAADALARIREELLPKVKAHGLGSTRPSGAASVAPAPVPTAALAGHAPSWPELIAIGCSTGGPNALATVFKALPASYPLPILVVQHMPPLFTSYLAKRLSSETGLPVREASHGTRVAGGGVWIAPGDHHMVVERAAPDVVLRLHQQPPENSCRPAVDVLFRSVAQHYGRRVLAVVLTGMGEDGRRGCEAIRAAGGRVVVQDEASSIVWGMPRAVHDAGLADKVLPLSDVALELRRVHSQSYPPPRRSSPPAASTS